MFDSLKRIITTELDDSAGALELTILIVFVTFCVAVSVKGYVLLVGLIQ